MGVTAFSFVLLPLCILWHWSPDRLLKLMLMIAVFEAAAAITIGSLGVQPWLMPGGVFIGYMLMQMLLGARVPGVARVMRVLGPFVAVTLWAVVSSYIMPRLFAGKIYVWPQKATPPFVLTPLAPTPGNFNQDVYIVMDCLLLVLGALYVRSKANCSQFIRVYLWSGFLVAGLAIWQFLHRLGGLPYPDDIFYSNPGLSILSTQTMGSLPRINGPFTEPSSLATYMVAIVCGTGWAMLQGHRERILRWLLFLGLLTIGLTTSATGIACICILAAGVPAAALATGSTRMMSSAVRLWLPATVLAVLLFMVAAVFVPSLGAIVQDVFFGTVNKQDSSSYKERSGADMDSLNVVLQSYGLGAGWGSNRSSSLVPGILASVGLPGMAALLWFGFGIAGQVRGARRLRCSADELLVIDVCCGGLVGYLLAAILSNPTLNSATFFFLLALLIGCTSRIASQRTERLRARVSELPETALAAVAAG